MEAVKNRKMVWLAVVSVALAITAVVLYQWEIFGPVESSNQEQRSLGSTGVAQIVPSSDCPPVGKVQHWDKIVFRLLADRSDTVPANLLNTIMDLKIPDPPFEVVSLDQEVRNALAMKFGLSSEDAAKLRIEIRDVKYQIVTCGATGPEGPQGTQGEQGDQGDQGVGVSNYSIVEESSGANLDIDFQTAGADCPPDTKVLGGGARISGALTGVGITASRPEFSEDGWIATGQRFVGNSEWSIKVIAICGDLSP